MNLLRDYTLQEEVNRIYSEHVVHERTGFGGKTSEAGTEKKITSLQTCARLYLSPLEPILSTCTDEMGRVLVEYTSAYIMVADCSLNFCQESQDGGISKLRCRNISDRKESLFNKLKIVKTMLSIGI